MPPALRIGIGAVVVVAILLGALWVFQRRLVYLPDPSPVPQVAQAIPGGRDVSLTTSDGLTLGAWYVPAVLDGTAEGCGMTVLVAPGNGGSRVGRLPLLRALTARGFGVLLMDYRGYGGNPGSPTEQGLAADARAALAFLTDQGIPAERLLFLGESLGGGVVTGLAAEQPPAGVVLRSPFLDLPAAAAVHYPFLPVRWLLRDEFPVRERVAASTVPLVVVLGDRDSVIPPEQSRAVAEAAGGAVRTVEVRGADHNDRALLDGPELIDAVVDLARQVAPPGGCRCG